MRYHVDIGDDTFEVVIEPGGIHVDGQPVDASEEVLEKAGIRLNAAGELDDGAETETRATPVTEEELERLSAFQDFISELDLDDLGESEEKQ